MSLPPGGEPRSGRAAAAAVVPARMGSSRLPGKPLIAVAGKTLIRHVVERVQHAATIGRVVVATDSVEILEHVRSFGGEARLTSPDHRTGTDRIGELLPVLDEGIIVNVQGDEPEVEPESLDRLVEFLRSRDDFDVATAAAPYPPGLPPEDTAAVKVVAAADGRALYFSRSPIPGSKSGPARGAGYPWLHVGVYAFRRDALARFLALPRGDLEELESLEQLRLLEHGVPVGVVKVARAFRGIDTRADLEAFRERAERA